MAKSIGLQLIEDRLKKQQEKGTQEYSSRTGKKIGDDFYTPDTDTLYRQYAKARGQKVAGGTANPIITSQRGVQANQNVSPSAERVAGRQTSYYDQWLQNKQKAEQMKANTKPSVRATAQDVKDALFGKAMNYGTVNPRISASEINTKYNSMTDDEASVYMTLRNQGRQAEADEYLKAVEYEINERNMNQTKQRAKEIGSDGVVAPLLYGAALSIPSSAGILYNAWQDAKGEATDMNHGAYGGSAAFNALYDAYVNGVNGEESPQWKKDLKGTAMTVAQMMGHMPAGMFAPLTMGASAASGASMDALNRGGTTEQALFGGLAAGAAEGAGSALSLGTMGKIFGKLGSKVSGKGMDRLRNLAKEIRKDKGRAIAIDLLKISGVEGSEEMVTEVMNALTDMAIMGENSNFNLVMEDAMAKGMSEEEAFDYAMKATGQNVLEAGKMGAMAGGLMGGLGMGVNAVTGRNIIPNNEEAIERARAQYEAATRQPETTAAEPVENPTVTPQNTSQNPVTVHETAISDELTNSSAETRTQPTEAQRMSEQEARAAESRKSALDKFFYKNGQDAFEEEFQKTGKVDHFNAFRTYYNAGLSGVKISDIRQTVFTEVANKDMLVKAYEAGAMDKKADLEARATNTSKLPRLSGVYGETSVLNSGKRLYTEAMAEAFGVRVKVERTLKQNGFYDPNERQITMAADAETYSGTISHEVGHFIRDIVPENFSEIREMVMTQLNKMDGKSVDQRLYEYDLKLNYDEEGNRTDAYDNDALIEEMVCDGLQAVVMSEKDARELFSKMEQQSPGLLQKLKDFLTDLLNKLRGLIEDEMYKEIALDLKKDEEFVSRLRDKVAEAAAAVKAKDAQAKTGGTELSRTEDRAIRHSVRSMADAAGLEAKKNPVTGVVTFELNGKPVKEVTAEHIRDNSGLGALIKVAEEAGNITEAEAEIQHEAMAEIMNMIISTQDPDLVWAWVGSSLFSAVKTNSDPQYGTTIDFTTVCRKTQDMITAMSKAMIKLGRGLTTEEVTELQQKLIAEDSAVPCPVCYVFSRWAGVGSILDNMRRWQEKYDGYSEERLQDRIAELTEKLGKGKTKDLRKMLKEQDERYFELEREKEAGAYRKKKLKEARKTADAVGKASIDEQIKVIDERAKKIKKELDRIKSSAAPELSWLLNVRTSPGYAKEGKVPNSILFNLDGAATFSEMYPLAWKYRSTRGPGAGKAILPYSDMRLGDMILGVKNNSANGSNLFANAKGELSKEQMAAVEKATARTKAQNLIGGQRFQSTSDFRYDYALDYLLAFMECQALGSKIQTYTKIIEYVDMIAAVGGDVNMSVMPKDKGYIETEDGKKLIFSSVTGIDFEAAKAANEMHDNAQLILVGINDEHIRLALDDFGSTNGEHIGFVIPYHASGASINEFIRVLVGNLGEEFRLENYVDYSDVQTDSERKNATPDQKRRALIRKGILQGRLGGKSWTPGEEELKLIRGKSVDISDRSFEDLRAIEQKAMRGDKAAIKEYESWSAGVLWDVYNKLWVNEGHPDFGVRLSSAQAGPVMPHEYWNKGVNREKAYVNGFIFRSYCYSLGLAPRFTGVGAKGKAHGDFSGSKGYWKTLIDRPMYNNDGTYREQQKVNVSRFQKEMLTEDYAKANWGDYKVQEPDAKRAERAAEKFVAEKQGEGFYGDNKKYSVRVTDKKTLDFLNGQETIKTYRAMQLIDGKLYPPMAAAIDGKLEDYSVLGEWEQAVEHPELATEDGYFKLNKGSKQSGVKLKTKELKARYNPYMHSSNVVLNDQFDGAYERYNLVTVECEVPVSEMTSGYKAEKAKDAVGWNEWKSGVVAGDLRRAKENTDEPFERMVFLSRWLKPVRIMDDSEVAKLYKGYLEGTDIAVPDSRVSPGLLKELIKIGVPIKETGKVKYSVRESGEAELLRENKELKKANENLRGIFNVIGRQRITETSAKEVATAWLKNIGSSYDKDEFSRKFKIIAEHMADARNEYEAEDAVEAMKNLAMEAMRKSEEVDTAAWEENKDLYNNVKSTKLFVSDDVAEDLKAYGGYASVVRDTYGKMDLSRKADKGVTDIDVLYGELNAENELLFPYEDGMTKADMLMNIADGMESLQPVMKNKYGYTEEEMAEDVVYDLFDRMGDLTYRTSSLESDLKSNEKYTQLKAEYEKRIAKVRREAEQQREKYESDAEARYARLKDRHKEQRINREMKKARETVERESKRLLTWLTGGTDKNHVPENMRVAVEKILTSITTKDARINQLQLIALKDVYGEHGPEGESGDYLEYDPDVTEILKKFTKQDKYKDGIIVLDDLSLEEMQNLSKMIRSLKHTIQKANKWMGLQRDLNVAEICDNQAFEWDNVKDATTYGAVRQLHKYFGMSMADANVFFKEFGKVAHETVWRGLRTAFDKKINFLAEAEEFSKEIDQKQVAKWRAMPPQKFELPSGDIWLTPTQVMSLYCLAKREDAKRHLYGGGMKAAAFKFMWKLGAKFPKEAMKQYAGRRVTEADINAITATLTDEQKATADKIQKFMVEHCAKWGNATSMLMFGYMKFGDPNYFPIRVDGDTLTSSVGDPQLRIKSIQNTGAAMPIDERAKNALVLEDIFSVLAGHVEEMSSYAAFVPALSDLNKFVNYKVRNENGEIIFSMKTSIGQKVGPDAMGYIYDLLETLNGSPRAVKEGILPKTLVRNAKTASVAANLRVIAQQPTAYLRAGIVLDTKYLLQGMAPGKVDKEEVFKYCPIARWKAMGNYDMNIGKTVEQLVTGQTLYQKIIDKSMAGAGWADSVTWGWIWKACKAETADKYPDLQGEEFLIKAGERMSEVIDDTQVVDSPLHRSQMMRNKSLYMQMITSYMSEPTKAVGLVASSVIECRKNPTKENKKKVMRTWRYLIATGILTAAFAGVADMFRDDDEDEEMWEKFLQAFWGDQINAETPKDRAVALLGSNIGDNLNPLNSLPLMRDVLSMLQGYEITRTDFAWMADIMNNIGKWNKYLSGESEYTLTALLGNTAQSLSKVTGMPVKSASRELDSVRRAVVGHMSGDIQYQNAKITYSISAEKNISRYVAMMLEARMNGDKALATKIYNEMVKAGIDNEKIDNKIDSVSKKALESEIEVADGAEAYREGDYDALIGAIDSLNKKGYSEKNATSAITKAYNKKYGDDEEEETTYNTITESYWNDDLEESPADYQMMENAFMFGSAADYNELWKVLELNGKKETNMKTTMKNRLRKIYHETGTSSSDKARIEKEFTRLGGKLETLYKKP